MGEESEWNRDVFGKWGGTEITSVDEINTVENKNNSLLWEGMIK